MRHRHVIIDDGPKPSYLLREIHHTGPNLYVSILIMTSPAAYLFTRVYEPEVAVILDVDVTP